MVLVPGTMLDDQLSRIQEHVSLTVWMRPYEVVSCLDEEDSFLVETCSNKKVTHTMLHNKLELGYAVLINGCVKFILNMCLLCVNTTMI